MTNGKMIVAVVLSLGVAAESSAWGAQEDGVKGAAMTLTGCVVTDKDHSFLLTNVQEIAGPSSSIPNATLDGLDGVKGGTPNAIYWLSKDSVKLIRGHVGHKVEVSGIITDVSTGTTRITQDPGKPGPDNDNKIEITANGKESNHETDASVTPGPTAVVKTTETKVMNVRRVKVDTVKVLAKTCQ
ncbi:MAG: hypothetical protein ABI672_07715 [Vicinamibacteria bacterium]